MTTDLSRLPDDPDAERAWWESTWLERETLLRERFGQTVPPGGVMGFFWDDIEVRVPGGCALTFPPRPPERHWVLTVGLGLSQPLSRSELDPDGGASGYGWEFALLTADQPPWRLDAIYLLMTYIRQSGRRIDPGHRVPLTFSRGEDGVIHVEIGRAATGRGADPEIHAAAMLFWPCLTHAALLRTSTGAFGLLTGTTVSLEELELAKRTSSAHVLLALVRMGTGQVSDPLRTPLTASPSGLAAWGDVERLSYDEAVAALAATRGAPGG